MKGIVLIDDRSAVHVISRSEVCYGFGAESPRAS